jgi:hypothetical protein
MYNPYPFFIAEHNKFHIYNKILIYHANRRNLMTDPDKLNPRERTLLATRFFKLLCEKNFDAERTGRPVAFTVDTIWTTDNLDGINKETIMPIIIDRLRKLDYIIVHADKKISINNVGKGHCNEEITLPEDIE